ncbi:MAG: Asd/ArgC dimerization domain-containing protein [Candidatus Aminicenantales bacterium]
MRKKDKYRLALVGTDSLRGKEIKNVLDSRISIFGKVDFFDPDVEEEYSKLTQFRGEATVIHHLDEESLLSADLVFLASDRKINRNLGFLAEKKKIKTIELNETFNRDAGIPVVVAGVNDEIVIREEPFLIANPNPVTIILSHLFNLVQRNCGLSRAISFVLQPVSAFENEGIDELADQSVALLSSTSMKKKVFKEQIAFNLLSYTEKPGKDGFCPVERQIISEIKRVFKGREFPFSLSLVQAPIFHTYSIMSFFEVEKETDIAELQQLFERNVFFKFSPPSVSCPVSSISVAGKEEIYIGQIKKEVSFANSFWVWTVADNLTRGSALNALEIAEKLFSDSPEKK